MVGSVAGEKISIKVVALAISATTSASLPVFLTGALSVQIRASLGLGRAATGFLVAVFFSSATVSSLTTGGLSEKRKAESVMKYAAFFSAAGMLGIALFARSFLTFALFLVISGLANGVMQPAVNTFVAGAIPATRQGLAFGVKQAAIPTATMLAGLAVPAVALTIGWRYGYVFAAAIAVVVAAVLPKGKSIRSSTSSTNSTAVPISIPPLIMLAFAMALGAGAANAMGAYLVENAVHSGIAPGSAGLLAALGSASGLSARLVSGYLADKRSGGHIRVAAMMVGIGAIGYLLFATQDAILLIPATLIGYGAGWGWNGLYNFAVVKNHPGAAGRATGITQSGAYVGSVIGPIGFGLIVQHVSFQFGWTLAATSAILSSVFMLFGRKMLIRDKNRVLPG